MTAHDSAHIRLYTIIIMICMLASIGYGQQVTTRARVQPPVVTDEPPTDRIGLGLFRNGFAAVFQGDDHYYINTKGEKIQVMGNAVWENAYPLAEDEQSGQQAEKKTLPSEKNVFDKGGKRGVFSPTGELIIPAEYDHIETEYRTFWRLYRGNKKTFYLPDGRTLPFFDEIGYLDGEYFDVKQNGSWHLYSKSKDKIVTKNSYEGFDFCGGCSTGAPYVHAKEDGKWGIISWDEEVLVPFEYEHEHRNMRSDNWVASFSLNGEQVIVHIPTQRVFDASSPDTRIHSGILVMHQDGKFGAYDQKAEQIVPFEYDKLESPNANSYQGYYGNYLIAQKDNKTGVIRADGTIVVPMAYKEVFVYDDFFVVKTDGNTHLLRVGEKEPLLSMEHVDISHVNNSFYSSGSGGLPIFKVKQKAYYGLYFAGNERYYEPTFYDVSLRRTNWAEGGEIIEADRQGLKTLFDIHGEKVLPFEVQDYKPFAVRGDTSLFAVKIKGKWGLYDIAQDKEIVPPGYDEYFKVLDRAEQVIIQAFGDGFSDIDLYDLQGNKLNESPLHRIEPISSQYYLLGKGERDKLQYMIFDAERQTTENLDYPYVATLRGTEKLVMVSHTGFDGRLYDVENKKELGRRYDVYMFSVIDVDVPPDNYQEWMFLGFDNGYAKVSSEDGSGYIDEQGEVLIPPKYLQARFVGKDHLLVSDGDVNSSPMLSYFIDKKEQQPVFPAEYVADEILFHNIDQYYIDGKVVLMRYGEQGELYYGMGELETGEITIPADYYEVAVSDVDSAYVVLTARAQERRNYGSKFKYGLATIDGEILFEPKFDAIQRPRHFAYGASDKREPMFPLLVLEGEKWRYINEDGSYLPVEGDYVSP